MGPGAAAAEKLGHHYLHHALGSAVAGDITSGAPYPVRALQPAPSSGRRYGASLAGPTTCAGVPVRPWRRRWCSDDYRTQPGESDVVSLSVMWTGGGSTAGPAAAAVARRGTKEALFGPAASGRPGWMCDGDLV